MSDERNGGGFGLEKPIAIYYEHPTGSDRCFSSLMNGACRG